MSELALQKSVVGLLQLFALPGVIWFAVPNGEARSARTGAKLKAMGVRAGVADLCVVPTGGWTCFLELKTPKGQLSAAQREFRDLCERNLGAAYVVATTPEDAAEALMSWGALVFNPLGKPNIKLRKAA